MILAIILSVAAFVLTAVLFPIAIPLLKKLKIGQQIRKEGNPDHYKKQGTPTMGGLVILLVLLAAGVVGCFFYTSMIPVLLLTVLLGIVGFLDDYIKVVKQRSEGLNPKQKMAFQIIIALAFAFYCYFCPSIGPEVIIPFTGGKTWNMGWLYIPFVFVALIGTDNGVNFSDGEDGLCAGITSVVCIFFMVISNALNEIGYFTVSGIILGSLLGFLIYNRHPAKVFMGDTGSLALGGFVAGTAICMKMGWFILIFGFVYLAEIVSVMIQVSVFKLCHGKRVFKMTPIHHHFEKCGYKETQIVPAFVLVTAIVCVVAYFAF